MKASAPIECCWPCDEGRHRSCLNVILYGHTDCPRCDTKGDTMSLPEPYGEQVVREINEVIDITHDRAKHRLELELDPDWHWRPDIDTLCWGDGGQLIETAPAQALLDHLSKAGQQ